MLREDAVLPDNQARNGVSLYLSLGLYHGEQICLPLLEAIHGCMPSPPPLRPVQHVASGVIYLDSVSLLGIGK